MQPLSKWGSLRTLGDDKMLLLEHFRRLYARQMQCAPFSLDEPAEASWKAYNFPGNTRELRNIVIRLITKHPGARLNASQLENVFDSTFSTATATNCKPTKSWLSSFRPVHRSRGKAIAPVRPPHLRGELRGERLSGQ